MTQQIINQVNAGDLLGDPAFTAFAKTNANFTELYTGQIALQPTSAENAASVTPVNFKYAPGVVDRYATNTTPGTTDMTNAIKAALAVQRNGGGFIQFLAGLYLVTDTCLKLLSTDFGVVIQGVPRRTIILNKAAANKPTIQMLGAIYWSVNGIVFIGATGFPNYGIELTKDGSANRTAFGVISSCSFNTNGGGIHVTDTNTIWIDNIEYWATSSSNYGGTIDTNGQPFAIGADGTGAVNDLDIRNVNVSGVNTIANGGAAIKADGTASVGGQFFNWTVDHLLSERPPATTQRALWLRNVNSFIGRNLYVENNEVRIDNSSQNVVLDVLEGGNTGTVFIDGTQSLGGCSYISLRSCVAKSLSIDGANSYVTEQQNIWGSGPYANSAINLVRFNTTLSGASLANTFPLPWSAPAFSAGDYTALGGGGSWTVSSGNVTDSDYVVLNKLMTINIRIRATTVGGTPAVLQKTIPGGFLPNKNQDFVVIYTEDNGTTTKFGLAQLTAGSGQIQFTKDLASTAFSTTTSLTGISASLTFEIQ